MFLPADTFVIGSFKTPSFSHSPKPKPGICRPLRPWRSRLNASAMKPSHYDRLVQI